MTTNQFSWGIPLRFQQSRRRTITVSDTTQFIRTERQAELNAAAQMRALGYKDAFATPVGPDGGIDVWSRKALAQVKFRSYLAGRPELQNLYGARGNDHSKELWFLVAAGYTQMALEYADEVGMFLFTYLITGELVPVNDLAKNKLTELLAERAKKFGKWKERRTPPWYLRGESASPVTELSELLGPRWIVIRQEAS